ncbi:MAG: radical SAM protein [Candidatus Omnitrophica bacterium]|jgi:hypothetical protein|nr:radical SAM protein [Candidatus Omnitrophota bacterium]
MANTLGKIKNIIAKLCKVRRGKLLTKILGPLHKIDHCLIEIDITYKCNLKCYNCDRSCSQAPSDDSMTVTQIRKFIKESIEQNRKWKRIRILGGEPTLHPELLEILNVFVRYKNDFSPRTNIELVTNGFGEEVNNVLARVPKDIIVKNTYKLSQKQQFVSFNNAPIDFKEYRYLDYSNGCRHLESCGIGLTKYGYYPCAPGGGIDRVFGLDIGKKKLPSPNDSMKDQMLILCKFCGWALPSAKIVTEEKMSPVWIEAYKKYKCKKPELMPY